MVKAPFLDLKAQYESIKDEINYAIRQVIESTAFSGGKFVEEFEKAFAKFCQCDYAIGVGSGTEALWLALLSLGIEEGDDVISVPNTFPAAVEAICFNGATPILVDVDEETCNVNLYFIEEAITKKLKRLSLYNYFARWQTWIQSWTLRSGMAYI